MIPKTFEKRDVYAKMMVELRKSKGLTMDEALKLLNNPLYFATVMIKYGDADGEVAGADNATGDVSACISVCKNIAWHQCRIRSLSDVPKGQGIW